MPLVNAVEVLREEVLELGAQVSNVATSDRRPEQTVRIAVKNLRDRPV